MSAFFAALAARLEAHLTRFKNVYGTSFLAGSIALTALWLMFLVPPLGFPRGEILIIEEGMAVSDIAYELESHHVIRSPFLFMLVTRAFGYEDELRAGPYAFGRPYGLLAVVWRIGNGLSGIPPTRVWLAEGMTARDMAERLDEALPAFDRQRFLSLTIPFEGYLFPDTYLILPDETAETIAQRLQETFRIRIEDIRPELDASAMELSDVVILASLIEREARSLPEKRMVSGVLHNRLELGMPLQVDAVFGYIQERETYSPSFEDLEINSPYNTYKHTGLPPGPISNPGLDSLLAAVTPAETSALYYLTGLDGVTRFARTFDEHKRNRELYLD